MMPSGRYASFRAPQGDGEILCVPSAAELPLLVADNRQRQELGRVEWMGRSLAAFARVARQEILADAFSFSRQYADVGDVPNAEAPLIFAGHQPDLFHPGVWLKNFEAARLAKTCGGTAINLIIDSDLCRSPAIRVPTGSPDQLEAEILPFDQAGHEVPFEERAVVDQALWKSFGARVTGTIKPLIPEPLIQEWWPTVLAASKQAENLGRALSRARHQLEVDWGFKSLELPQSHVCRSEAFRLFALELFWRADDFRDAYNQSLAHYRAGHRLKNHAQPVPNLVESDGWIETPFWLWTVADPRRRGVFVRRRQQLLEITDRHGYTASLPADAQSAVDQLGQWETQGIKLRTRALATTLFTRLLLADVFIHGIGGAKYDQVTDEICTLFCGVTMPRFATISGTLRLPIEAPQKQPGSLVKLRQELREHEFHPERHRTKMVVTEAEKHQAAELIDSKQAWIVQAKTTQNAAERHQAIKTANRKLQAYLNSRREIVEHEIATAKLAASTAQLRNSREYAYCLFPTEVLHTFFKSEKV